MQPPSPTFATPSTLTSKLQELLPPRSPLLKDPDFLSQCSNFYNTLQSSPASPSQKHEYLKNYVLMLAEVKGSAMLQQESRTRDEGLENAEEDEIERFIREQDGKIARLEQEREWLREENKRRKPDRSTVVSSQETKQMYSNFPSQTKSQMFNSKINISQVIEQSSGYQDSSDFYSYKPSLDSLPSEEYRYQDRRPERQADKEKQRQRERQREREKQRHDKQRYGDKNKQEERWRREKELKEKERDKSRKKNLVLQDSEDLSQSQMSLQEAYSRRHGGKTKKDQRQPLKRQKSKEQLIQIRKKQMKYRPSQTQEHNYSQKRQKSQPIEISPTRHKRNKSKEPTPQLMRRLISGERARVSSKEARQINKRTYEKLPQNKRKEEERRKQEELERRLARKKEYEKRVNSQQRYRRREEY